LDSPFQTSLLKTVFEEMENDVNTFFPHNSPEGPLFSCCDWHISSFLVREISRNASAGMTLSPQSAPGPALVTTTVTEQWAASDQLPGPVTWGWQQERASRCPRSYVGWWHSKGCSSLPPGWPLPSSIPFLPHAPTQKERLTFCRNTG